MVTPRSAAAPATEPEAVAALLAEFGSVVLPLLLTDAVSEKFAPGLSELGAETTMVKISDDPGAIAALAVSVTVVAVVPVVNVSVPPVRVAETRTDPAGSVSVRTTPEAVEGPLLERV